MPGRAALFTVIHPGSLPFLDAWTRGVLNQSEQGFTLCAATHGLGREQMEAVCRHLPGTRLMPYGPNANPIDIRNRALTALCEDFDRIVCTDSDDVMLPERVALDLADLESQTAVSSGMELMDEAGRPIKAAFSSGFEDRPIRTNRHGLSNTAFRSELLRRLLPVPEGCTLMDWFLAARALCLGSPVAWREDVRLRYRQYPANTARVLRPFTPETVRRGAELVRVHLGLMLASNPLPAGLRDDFTEALCEVGRFAEAMEDEKALIAYCDALNELETDHVWWTFVAHPRLESYWHDDA